MRHSLQYYFCCQHTQPAQQPHHSDHRLPTASASRYTMFEGTSHGSIHTLKQSQKLHACSLHNTSEVRDTGYTILYTIHLYSAGQYPLKA
jgi:hypothetical protein